MAHSPNKGGRMATRTKDSKPKRETKPARKPSATGLKDLEADPAKADKVKGGPASCRTYGSC